MPEPKINARNLHYDNTLPPFLARLRGQEAASNRDGGPDPMLAARRRPGGKKRSASEEAEDAPLVVDEQGNVISMPSETAEDEDEAAAKGQNGDQPQKEVDKTQRGAEGDDKAEKVAGIGAMKKKRKVGRVVGEDEFEEESKDEKSASDRKKATSEDKKSAGTTTKGESTTPASSESKTIIGNKKKKAKKIKLSFGDDEEGG